MTPRAQRCPPPQPEARTAGRNSSPVTRPWLPGPVPYLLRPVPGRPAGLRRGDELLQHQPGQGRAGGFAGLANYRELFRDNQFWPAMWHTILFTLVSTPPLVCCRCSSPSWSTGSPAASGSSGWRSSCPTSCRRPPSPWSGCLYEPGYGLIAGFFNLIGVGDPGWLSTRTWRCTRSSSSPSGGRSASTSSFTSRACRRSRGTCTRPLRSTAPASGSRPGG